MIASRQRGYGQPVNLAMAPFQLFGQSPLSLGDNLKRARDRIERFPVVRKLREIRVPKEGLNGINVFQYVLEALRGILRRYSRLRAVCFP